MKSLAALILVVAAAGLLAGDGPVGWQELPNTALKKVAPPNNCGGIKYDFADHCHSVIAAWSSAVADTKRDRLIIWGGGHSDYYGNEVYALDLNSTPARMSRLTDPSPWDFEASNQINKDGSPVSRHTYNGIVYLPTQDRMFSFEGGTAPNGSGSGFTFTLDLSKTPPVWQSMDPTKGYDATNKGKGGSVCGSICAYDPNTDSVLCNWGNLFMFLRYTPSTNTWTKVTAYCESVVPGASTAVVDPKRKLMIFIGEAGKPKVMAVDISAKSNFKVQDWSSQVTGCDALAGVNYPGLAYDPVLDRIVGWANSGDNVYVFDPETKSCETLTYPNGPKTPPGSSVGTFGHFSYFPALKAYVVVNNAGQNAYMLRLPATLPAKKAVETAKK